MAIPLRVLLVEDSEDDALLLLRELRRGGYDPVWQRIESEESLRTALRDETWELIIADYNMPHFTGRQALEILNASGLDIPFLLVSGAVEEQTAIDIMRAGAKDFILKSNLVRLAPSVQRELHEAQIRRDARAGQIALQESEFFLRQVLDSTPQITFVVDEQGKILLANRALAEFYQLPLERIVGRTQYMIHQELGMSTDELEDWLADNRRTLEEGPIQFEEFSHLPGGKGVWYRTKKLPLMLRDGTRAVLVISEDISETVEREQQLKVTNRTLRMLSDVNQTLIRATDEQSFLHDVCRLIVEIGGYRLAWIGFREHDAQKTVRPVAYFGQEQGYLDFLNVSWSAETPRGRGPAGRAAREGEIVIVQDARTDESFVPWREEALKRGYSAVIAFPLKEEGEIFGVITIYGAQANAFVSDEIQLLTELADDLAYGIVALRTRVERARVEAALARESAFLSTAIELLPFPIVLFTPNLQVIRENHANRVFLSEHNVESWLDIEYHRADTHALLPREQVAGMRALHGEVVVAEEEVARFPNGEEVPVLAHAAPIIIDGNVVAGILAVQDISELRAVDQAKNQFLAVLSHELKTPLTSMLGWVQHAKDSPEVIPQALEIIERNAQRQRQVLNTLLDVSKIITGRFTVRPQPADLWTLAHEQIETLRSQIERSHLRLEIHPPKDPLPVLADVLRFKQAIGEVLGNAIKFTPVDGVITVSAWREGGEARLAIHDTGRGLSPEQLGLLFKPFLQIERMEATGGLGIGLILVKGIVEQHGGRITVESPGIGLGSTFTIALPLRQE